MSAQPSAPDVAAPATPRGWARLASRGILCGAAGGLVAALVDALRARGELGRLLPDGASSLWLFLVSLYGGVFALLGLGLGLLLALLVGLSGRQSAHRGRGLPLVAALLALAAAAAALGAALYGPTLQALLRFHHRGLIALAIGVLGAVLLPAAAVLFFLLVTALARLPGPRVSLRSSAAPALLAAALASALPLFSGAVTVLLLYLQAHPRMGPPLRALNLALLAPPLGLLSALFAYVLGRALSLLPFRERPFLRSRAAIILLPLLVLCAGAAPLAIVFQEPLRIVDLRPVTTLFCATFASIALALLLRRRRLPGLLALPLLPLLLCVALVFGQGDRVRKAALSQAPLCAVLVSGLQAIFDLDRDRYPSRYVIGGSDCDDLDPGVHPGAFDWPGDGIDQNCNGNEAALPGPAAPFPPVPVGLPARPSIVLLTIDALRADHVGAYGYGRATTPALDALAREGTLFVNAWAHAPSTRYSVPAILSGRYPSVIAWGSPQRHWPPEVLPENRLLAEMLKERGYHTTALLSYHYFEPSWGLGQGFDDYDVHLMSLHSLGGDPAATSGSSSRELADLALGKLAALPSDQPFFLWTHFYDPHYRYQHHPEVPSFGDGSREEDLYDNEIRYTDEHIGRVLAALRARPDWPRMVVIVTADHGEGFGEHGIPKDRRHGYHLYANQTQVPLLVRAPGVAPRRVTAPVGHIDLYPTLLLLAGGAQGDEPQLLGRPVLSLLAGGKEDRVVFQEVMYEGPTVRKALVTDRWHYLQNVIPDGTAELYDLSADRGEERDLQGTVQVAGAEAALRRRLAAWMDESALAPDFARRIEKNISQAPLPFTLPLSARIGDLLEVVGADVAKSRLGPGDSAEIAVVWKVLRRVPPGWRLFSHLVMKGAFVNADHDPLEGLVPLQQLSPGQYVRDVLRIPIPPTWPPGRAVLELGLFRGGERAPVSGSATDSGARVVHAATLEIR